ncbi:type VII secretion protein EccCb [Dactylosporangium sp. CA-092794]|uniref:type VII secretion protein EccCb n=1 Tax=Dactylosporangium sp. CA-092794 TaxID=3239929 RepID=UPI003D914295
MTRQMFHRPARFVPPELPADKVVLPQPPEAAQPNPAGSWMAVLLPLLGSVGMAAYMITFGRPLLVVIGIIFVLGAVGATVGMRWQMRATTRSQLRRRRIRYRAHLATTRANARRVAEHQQLLAAWAHPSPERLFAIAGNRARVWERRQSDADFLKVRLGLGEAELATPLQIGNRLDPMADYDWESMRAARRLVSRFGRVHRQPLLIDLGGSGVASVIGPPRRAAELVSALVCQVAVLHAPGDVLIAVDSAGAAAFDWMKWLPHAQEPDSYGPAGTLPLIATDVEHLTEFLGKQLLQRQEQAAARRMQVGYDRRGVPVQQRLLVIFSGFDPVSEFGRSALLRDLLDNAGPQYGLTLLFLVRQEGDEPGRVDLRIRVGADGALAAEGRLALLSAPTDRAAADLVPVALAEQIARRIAPLVLGDEREQLLTRTVSLAEMLLGRDLRTAEITAGWVGAEQERVLKVPIGTDGEGEPVILDMKESAQGGSGPHGLVVGATGSGKSELMRTLVTALALTHSPELLSFVLVDFKGGATFASLVELPHVAGLITNLADDLALVDRMQAALQGEQQRRQQLLRAAGNVDSVRDYQVRQASGATGADGRPLPPLPYLLIIVDEFGELLSRRPDLVDLFVQIGRVGRSLGMHLLLATQRLEEGRLRGLDSHLSYRICLRTFSAAESRTVIGTTDAYRLPAIPGSAYLKVDESIYQRFRVAHVSAPYRGPGPDEGEAAPATLVPFDLRRSAAEQEAPAPTAPAVAEGPAESQVVVERLRSVGRLAHQVWLPPLPTAVALDEVLGPVAVQPGRGLVARIWPLPGSLKVPVGIIDLPALQQQQKMVLDFSGPHGHLAVVGAPQMGRSTLLRTLLLAAMLTHTPEELQVYCIDLGGGGLHQLAGAPHVGAVAGRTDVELVGRTLAELRGLIAERERLFRRLGVDNIAGFRALRDAGTLPAGVRAADVFLVIDNWGALRAEFEPAEGIVTEIAARGLGAGVHLVLTTNRWSEIRSALRDSIGSRLEFRLNDPYESEINRQLAKQIPAAAGRGIVAPGVFCQILLPRVDGAADTDGLREALQGTVEDMRRHWSGPAAPRVRLLPERITVDELDALAATLNGSLRTDGVRIGVGETDLNPVGVDLTGGDAHFLVFGDTGSGKTEFLRTYLHGLVRHHTSDEARVVLVDYRRSLLGALPGDYVAAYAGDAEAAGAYATQVAQRLRERLPPPDVTPQQLRERSWWEGSDIYVVVDDYDLVGGGLNAPLAPLQEFLPHARDVGLHLVLARRVAGLSRAMNDPLIGRIRELGCSGLVLSGDRREGAVLGEERAEARPPGRGVLVRRGAPGLLVQVATGAAELATAG